MKGRLCFVGEMREENLMPEIKDFSSSFSVPRAERGRGGGGKSGGGGIRHILKSR